jgi:hypothetical protein
MGWLLKKEAALILVKGKNLPDTNKKKSLTG